MIQKSRIKGKIPINLIGQTTLSQQTQESGIKSEIYTTGGTGRLGKEVLKRIPEAIPLVRKQAGLKKEIVTDFSENELKGILKNATAVIHLAGSLNMADEKDLWETNYELTKKIVRSTPKDCRIVYTSSIAVYGKKLAEIPANESILVHPDSAYARSKYEGEKAVAAHTNNVCLRIGPIYGPSFEDYNKVLSMLESGKMRMIGEGKNQVSFVHVEDVADVVVAAINKGSGIYVVSGDAISQRELLEVACRELGAAAPAKKISLWLALTFAGLGELRYRLFGGRKPILLKEHVAVLGYDRSFDCRKAKEELGFTPRKINEGIKEVVINYKIRQKSEIKEDLALS